MSRSNIASGISRRVNATLSATGRRHGSGGAVGKYTGPYPVKTYKPYPVSPVIGGPSHPFHHVTRKESSVWIWMYTAWNVAFFGVLAYRQWFSDDLHFTEWADLEAAEREKRYEEGKEVEFGVWYYKNKYMENEEEEKEILAPQLVEEEEE